MRKSTKSTRRGFTLRLLCPVALVRGFLDLRETPHSPRGEAANRGVRLGLRLGGVMRDAARTSPRRGSTVLRASR